MATQTKIVTTAINAGAGIAWINLSNLFVIDDTFASVDLFDQETSQSAKCSMSGNVFTIPTGSTIDRIKVVLKGANCNAGNINVVTVRMMVAGNAAGNNKAANEALAIITPTDITWDFLNSGIGEWNLDATVAQVNATDFGVFIQLKNTQNFAETDTGFIDAVEITITYTSVGGTTYTRSLTATEIGTTILNRKIKYIRNKSSIEVSVPIINRVFKYFRGIPAISTGLGNFAEVSIPNISRTFLFYRTLISIENSVSIFSRQLIYIRQFVSTVLGISAINRFFIFIRILLYQEIIQSNINRTIVFIRNMFSLENSNSIIHIIFQYVRNLFSALVSVTNIDKNSIYARSIFIFEIGVPILRRSLNYIRNISIENISIAYILRASLYIRNFIVYEISIPLLIKVSIFLRNLFSIGVSTSNLLRILLFFRDLFSLEISILTFSKISTFFRNLFSLEISNSNIISIIKYIRSLFSIENSTIIFNIQYIYNRILISFSQSFSSFYFIKVRGIVLFATAQIITFLNVLKSFFRPLYVQSNFIPSILQSSTSSIIQIIRQGGSRVKNKIKHFVIRIKSSSDEKFRTSELQLLENEQVPTIKLNTENISEDKKNVFIRVKNFIIPTRNIYIRKKK